MNKKQIAIDFAVDFANNDDHGYTQSHPQRWGQDADCSSLVIRAWDAAGVPVKAAGATYTGNMAPAFLASGFIKATGVNLSTGAGLLPGDVLLRVAGHTALYIGGGQIVQAAGNEKGGITGGQPGDQTGKELYVRNYYNSPWDMVLRYVEEGEQVNPYNEPTATYAAGVTFRGNDASWFIYELIKKGYDLIAGSNVAGANTWAAIYDVQAKAGLTPGDAGELTRAALKGVSTDIQSKDKEIATLKARLEAIRRLTEV